LIRGPLGLVLGFVLVACGSGSSDQADAGLTDAGLPDSSGTPDDAAPSDAGPPPEEIALPTGTFWRGCNILHQDSCASDELPYRELTLSAYLIDSQEVTQADYAVCVTDGACVAPDDLYTPEVTPDLPIRGVRWTEALAYCTFRGKRLPSEAEWERAMRGDDGRTYPWGEEPPDCERAVLQGCDGPLDIPGRAAGASPFGLRDGAGNVREWVNDRYDSGTYAIDPDVDPRGPDTGNSRVIRGGSYVSPLDNLRVASRVAAIQTLAFDDVGFRCARTP
jgi:formylglycine-generating enzyme required for sulfatase activity